MCSHQPTCFSHANFFFIIIILQLITEQASFTLPRGAEIEGKCGSAESEISITWKNKAYTLRIYFAKVGEGGRANGDTVLCQHLSLLVTLLGQASQTNRISSVRWTINSIEQFVVKL